MKYSVFLLFLLGIGVRLLFLDGHMFWFDEAASLSAAQQSFYYMLVDTHPPLFFLILKLWSYFSTDYRILRLLSVGIGAASLLVHYSVFHKLMGHKVALLSMLFLALSPLHIYYSTEVRGYALLVLLTHISLWSYLKFIRHKNAFSWGCLTISLILGFYTHYYFGLVTIGLIAYTYLKHPALLKHTFLAILLSMFSFIPWIFYTITVPKPGCWCFPPLIGLSAFIIALGSSGLGLITIKDYVFYLNPFYLSLLLLPAVLLFLSFVLGTKQLLQRKENYILPYIFVAFLVVVMFGIPEKYFSPRGLMITMPLYYAIAASGIMSIKTDYVRNSLLFTTILTLIITIFSFNVDPFFRHPTVLKDYLSYIIYVK